MNKLSKVFFTLNIIIKHFKSKHKRIPTKRRKPPIHIVFSTVDHYEPGTGGVDYDVEMQRVKDLLEKYPKLVSTHSDSAGNIPKRTWFFPPHYHRNFVLKKLVGLCEKGFGEVELHLHHGKSKPDTAENLEKTLRQCIKEYSEFGIFGDEDGEKKYGFIHGDWALDNSRKGKYCGVNNELDVLIKTGCYADYTFPAMNESNPSQLNSIYYAVDDPLKPKSYDTGKPVSKNQQDNDGLMIVQGPISLLSKNDKLHGIRVFGDAIDGSVKVTKKRIDSWVHAGIHVEGVPDVVFIKTHTHGATDHKAVLGEEMDFIFSYLETNYNDSEDYILHYATAREMYNIINALKDGYPSDQVEEYRDYKIKPPIYDSSPDISGASAELEELVFSTYPRD